MEVRLACSYKSTQDYVLLVVDKQYYENIFTSKKSHSERRNPGLKTAKPKKVAFVLKGVASLYFHDSCDCAIIRRSEYSNTLLLCSVVDPPTSEEKLKKSFIFSEQHAMFELQPAKPECNALQLLQTCYLTEDEVLGKAVYDGRLYTFSELALFTNSTPSQLAESLKSREAVVFQAKVRLLDPLLLYSSLYKIVATSLGKTVAMGNLPPPFWSCIVKIVQVMFRTPSGTEAENALLPGFKANKTLAALAGYTFLTHESVATELVCGVKVYWLSGEAFLESWIFMNSSLFGSSDDPQLGSIESIASILTENLVLGEGGKIVWWIPNDTLPSKLETRLKVLFRLNSGKWAEKNLKAFIEPLLLPGQALSAAVQRYVREYRVPGQPVMYSQLTS